jgi:hypothetical protein
MNGTHYEIDGATYPRVTSILTVLNKPGIAKWYGRVGLEEAERIAETSRTLGTAIHEACRAYVEDGAIPDDSFILPWVMEYGRWYQANVATLIGSERLVVSRRWRYAGTADLVAILTDGTCAVLDLKTAKSVDATYRLQLAAYQQALAEEGIDCRRRVVVHLPSDRQGVCRTVEFGDDQHDFASFLSALDLWRWHEEHRDDWRKH